jgi:hypothetical protein
VSHLAYPPRLPVEFSESIARLIYLTKKIKNEVAKNKNELNRAWRMAGGASSRIRRPTDAKSILLGRQVRRSKIWVSIAGHDNWHQRSPEPQIDEAGLRDALLKHLEQEFRYFQQGGICPMTKVTTLSMALARFPVVSIRQLSECALVSESTAKRWLFSLQQSGRMTSLIQNGQRQFINERLISILDEFAQ